VRAQPPEEQLQGLRGVVSAANIAAAGKPARTTRAPASANITARGTGARTAGPQPSASNRFRNQCNDCALHRRVCVCVCVCVCAYVCMCVACMRGRGGESVVDRRGGRTRAHWRWPATLLFHMRRRIHVCDMRRRIHACNASDRSLTPTALSVRCRVLRM
jgi:hypothetical protein